MVLNDISLSETKHEEEKVIIKSYTERNKIKENTYVNTSLVVDTNLLDKPESHVYDHLQRTHDNAPNCKGGCVTRFKQYKDCIMLSLIGVLFIAVTVLAIFIGLPEKSDGKGSWNDWEAWSDCSATCSYGMERRGGMCSISSGIQCYGDSSEYRLCNKMLCPAMDGEWSAWSAWGTCSATCGTGLHRRNRTCSNPAPDSSGKPCFGDVSENQLCNMKDCEAMDGEWSAWSAWGTCSATCGTGLQRRNRTCSNPAPDSSGKPCFGDVSENQLCNLKVCEDNRVAFTATNRVDQAGPDLYFSKVIANFGNGYNNLTGKFTSSIPGLYYFSATLTKRNGNFSDLVECFIKINSTSKIGANQNPWNDNSHNNDYDGYSLSMSGTFHLNKYDVVYIGNCKGQNGLTIGDDPTTSFTGFLISPDN